MQPDLPLVTPTTILLTTFYKFQPDYRKYEMINSQSASYMTNLKIRKTEYQRGVIIAASTLLFAMLSTIGFGLLTDWNRQYVYVMVGFDILLMISFLMFWVRLEITKSAIDLLDHLK